MLTPELHKIMFDAGYNTALKVSRATSVAEREQLENTLELLIEEMLSKHNDVTEAKLSLAYYEGGDEAERTFSVINFDEYLSDGHTILTEGRCSLTTRITIQEQQIPILVKIVTLKEHKDYITETGRNELPNVKLGNYIVRLMVWPKRFELQECFHTGLQHEILFQGELYKLSHLFKNIDLNKILMETENGKNYFV